MVTTLQSVYPHQLIKNDINSDNNDLAWNKYVLTTTTVAFGLWHRHRLLQSNFGAEWWGYLYPFWSHKENLFYKRQNSFKRLSQVVLYAQDTPHGMQWNPSNSLSLLPLKFLGN